MSKWQEILSEYGKVSGLDGQKMSKSYGNTIPVFAEGKELKKLINGIKTDSIPVGAAKDPNQSILFDLYSLFASVDEQVEMRQKFLDGIGYGDVKSEIIAKIDQKFGEAREARKKLTTADAQDILYQGGRQAACEASSTIDEVRRVVGLR